MKGPGLIRQMAISRWEGLRRDPHVREVARGTALGFLLQIGGSGLAFGFNVAVTRLVGVAGAGIFFLALSIAALGSVISRGGLDNALLRFVATKASLQDWAGVRGVYRKGIGIAVLSSAVAASALFLGAGPISNALFSKPELAAPLRWMSLSILPFTLLSLQAESFKGIKRIREAMLVQGIGVPFFSLLLILPLARAANAEGIGIAYFVSTSVVAALGIRAWQRALPSDTAADPFPLRELWESCRPLFGVSLMSRAVLPSGPLFLLGIWASSEDVGIFGAATRLSILVSIILSPASNVLAPKFAELFAKKDMEALERTARRSAGLTLLIASPLFLTVIFFAGRVMALFGPGFEQGAAVLAVLAVGQFVNAYTGSVGFVLIMGGRESEAWKALLYSAATSLALFLLLIPQFGALGCAIGVTLGEALKNVMLIKFCKDQFGIVPIPLLNRGRNEK